MGPRLQFFLCAVQINCDHGRSIELHVSQFILCAGQTMCDHGRILLIIPYTLNATMVAVLSCKSSQLNLCAGQTNFDHGRILIINI